MTSTRKPTTKTREQRNAEWEALAIQFEAFDSEEFEESEPERWERLTAKYSPRNAALILSQYPDAVECAGYKQWIERNRQVRKGEKSIAILAPAGTSGGIEIEDKDTGEATGEKTSVKRHFKIARVFDIGQTELIPPAV